MCQKAWNLVWTSCSLPERFQNWNHAGGDNFLMFKYIEYSLWLALLGFFFWTMVPIYYIWTGDGDEYPTLHLEHLDIGQVIELISLYMACHLVPSWLNFLQSLCMGNAYLQIQVMWIVTWIYLLSNYGDIVQYIFLENF
jgi:hypothetical protein